MHYRPTLQGRQRALERSHAIHIRTLKYSNCLIRSQTQTEVLRGLLDARKPDDHIVNRVRPSCDTETAKDKQKTEEAPCHCSKRKACPLKDVTVGTDVMCEGEQ